MLKKYALLTIIMAIMLVLGACGRNSSEGREENIPASMYNQQETTAVDVPVLPIQDAFVSSDTDWIILFEGQPIYENDLRFVAGLLGLAIDSAETQDFALNQLLEFLAIIDGVNRHGLNMTTEERGEMLVSAQALAEKMKLSGIISDDRLLDFYTVGILVNRLADHYVAEFTINLADHGQAIADFAEVNRRFLANIELQYIINQDFGFMRELRERLVDEGVADFGELVREYSIFYATDGGAIVYSMDEFLQIFDLYNHDIVALYGLQAGDISHVFNIEDFFFLAHIVSRTEATDSEIEEAFIEWYRFERRADNIDEMVEVMVANADYIINQTALDAMR